MEEDIIAEEELPLSEQIFSICNSLGGYERVIGPNNKISKKYYLGDECLDMKEILRYEDRTALEVYCEFWRLKVLEKDLIPIIMINSDPSDSTQSNLTLVCIHMTWPLDLAPEIDILDEDDIDISQIDRATKERVKSQFDYKAIFVQNPETLRIIHDFLKSFLSMEKRERTQKDNTNIRLLLHLFRNLIAIKDLEDHNIPRTTLQNKLIILYEKEGIFGTLFKLVYDHKELPQWDMLIQEIFYHVFYDVVPQFLLKDPKEEAKIRAEKLLEEELIKKSKNQNKDTRYNGSVWIKVPPGKDLTIHKRDGVQGNGPKVLDSLKKKKYQKTLLSDELDKKRRNSIIHDQEAHRCLKSTAVRFFTKTFNALIVSVRKKFESLQDDRPQQSVHFFYIVWFFLEFRNLLQCSTFSTEAEELGLEDPYYNFELVCAIMDYEGFLFVFEKISVFRKEKRWSDLHFGLDCLKQMLLTAQAMKRFDDRPVRYKAEYILNKIYYEEENLGMMMLLVREFKEQSFGQRLESCSETTFEIEEISRTRPRTSFEMEEKYQDTDDYDEVIEYVKVNRENSKQHKLVFEEYQMCFVNESIISTYCSLLEYYETIDSESLYHITTAFHRIIVRCSADTIFFKLSILELLNRISIYFEGLQTLTSSQKEFKDFIRLISESFFDYAEKNDLMYCEVFCPKTAQNWKCLKYGYDYSDRSKKRSDVSSEKLNSSDELDETAIEEPKSKRRKKDISESKLKRKENDEPTLEHLEDCEILSDQTNESDSLSEEEFPRKIKSAEFIDDSDMEIDEEKLIERNKIINERNDKKWFEVLQEFADLSDS
ncbi:3591_t:CDS:10 [Scutellospora calospora]|uniref:3591_t:CDS:1 n=1 Tax=Scutellospora calospora TaxID=85575 RepID=A0ACA9KBY4_9GLOM|nr:3591_t:CDS:10 [Scutellospora calospora]